MLVYLPTLTVNDTKSISCLRPWIPPLSHKPWILWLKRPGTTAAPCGALTGTTPSSTRCGDPFLLLSNTYSLNESLVKCIGYDIYIYIIYGSIHSWLGVDIFCDWKLIFYDLRKGMGMGETSLIILDGLQYYLWIETDNVEWTQEFEYHIDILRYIYIYI